ncbi:MAG: Flp pilus assembly protein CpaB [Asticcacaulis sp. 32-58-5]|nr:MAG: Flp pilus assembly protein CpaB [Asticcacaulis sp. 32-58-5]
MASTSSWRAVRRRPSLIGSTRQATRVTPASCAVAGRLSRAAVMLESGKRAMAVPISAENAAAGFILPGDRVDIMVSRELQSTNGGRNQQIVEPVLRNIKVLAIDQNISAAADTAAVIGATATLELTPEDGQALALARSQGSLSLMLRSYADVSAASGRVNSQETQMATNTVRVFRNGQASEVSVAR